MVSYDDLLEEFWRGHDPTRRSWSRQYRSAVFVHDDGQRRVAEESKRHAGERRGEMIRSSIEPLDRFYPAEDYHQKYSLRQHGEAMAVVSDLMSKPEQLRDSTLAARLNGWLAGYGTRSAGEVRRELEDLGTPPAVRDRLLDVLSLRQSPPVALP